MRISRGSTRREVHRAPSLRGFTLLEVLAALVMLALLGSLVVRLTMANSRAVAAGRRWTAMATAADREAAALALRYRSTAPACLPPPAGSAYTAEGVGLAWRVAGDSARIELTVEARALSAGRPLVDSVRTAVTCR
ncbi:MAG: prepilin-type N-terminal cleavage/methylation domain-containing protein [Gemmatimonadales bacterium]